MQYGAVCPLWQRIVMVPIFLRIWLHFLVHCHDFLFFAYKGLGVASLEGPLYAVGGHDGWSYLNSVERWDPVTRQWSFVAPMNSQRSTVGVAALNGK